VYTTSNLQEIFKEYYQLMPLPVFDLIILVAILVLVLGIENPVPVWAARAMRKA
jgi:hypothetical protein